MTHFDMIDAGYAITLIRIDGNSVCLSGDSAGYFREEWQDCPSEWSVSRFIAEVGYDILFDE